MSLESRSAPITLGTATLPDTGPETPMAPPPDPVSPTCGTPLADLAVPGSEPDRSPTGAGPEPDAAAASIAFRRAPRHDTPPKTAAEAWERLKRAHATAVTLCIASDDLDAAAHHARQMQAIEDDGELL